MKNERAEILAKLNLSVNSDNEKYYIYTVYLEKVNINI